MLLAAGGVMAWWFTQRGGVGTQVTPPGAASIVVSTCEDADGDGTCDGNGLQTAQLILTKPSDPNFDERGLITAASPTFTFSNLTAGEYLLEALATVGSTVTSTNPVPLTVASGGSQNVEFAIQTTGNFFNLTVDKTVDVANPAPGTVLNYTIAWSATGPGFFPAAYVSDNPNEAYLEGIVVTSGGGTYDGDRMQWDLGTINLGGGTVTGSVTYKATLKSTVPAGTIVTNTASFGSIEGAPVHDTVSLTVGGTSSEEPELAIVKEVLDVNGGQVKRGDTLQYTITVENIGAADAPGVRVQDNVGPYLEQFNVTAIPSGATDTSTATGGTNGTGYLNVGGFDLEPSKTGAISYTAVVASTAPDGQTIPNVAVASCDGCATVQDDASVVVVAGTVITPSAETDPELVIVKNVVDVNGGLVERGDTLRYSISVGNVGNGAATGVHVHDNVGVYLDQFTVATTPSGSTDASVANGGTNGNGYLDIHQFSIAPAAEVLIEYTAVVASDAPDSTPISNIAVASDDQGDVVQDDANVIVSVEAPGIVLLPSTPTSTVRPSGGAATPSTPVEQPEAVVTPVTGIDPATAAWIALAGALVAAIVGYATYSAFKVLR